MLCLFGDDAAAVDVAVDVQRDVHRSTPRVCMSLISHLSGADVVGSAGRLSCSIRNLEPFFLVTSDTMRVHLAAFRTFFRPHPLAKVQLVCASAFMNLPSSPCLVCFHPR